MRIDIAEIAKGFIKAPPLGEDRPASPWHAMAEDLVKCYGELIGMWLAKRVGNDLRYLDLTCSNNFRTCKGYIQSKEYKSIIGRGCCGYFDERYTFRRYGLVRHFWVGLNYGH